MTTNPNNNPANADRVTDESWWDLDFSDVTHGPPSTLDPYSEHPQPYPGAQPSEAPTTRPDREFTNRPPAPELVVHHTRLAPDQVITRSRITAAPVPFAAPNPVPSTLGPPTQRTAAPAEARSPWPFIPWCSLLLGIAAQGAINGVTAIGGLSSSMSAFASIAMAVNSVILVIAELVARADGQRRHR